MNRLFKEANKIWPAKYAIPILIVFFVFSALIMMTSHFIENQKTKNNYNSFQISGRIEKSIKTSNYHFCKINNDWFGIQGEINLYISQYDKLHKESDSYDLTVIKENGKTNTYHFPETYFQLVQENQKLIKYFKTSKLIPDSVKTPLKKLQ